LREKWAKKIFRQSHHNGQVSDMVLSWFRNAVSLDIYMELMQGHKQNQLPASWTCNVMERSNYNTHNNSNKHVGKLSLKRRKAEV